MTDHDTTSHDIISPPPQHGFRWYFEGDDGLRAGWSLLLFIGFFGLLVVGGNLLLATLHLVPPPPPRGSHVPPHEMTPRLTALGEFIGFGAVLLASWFMSLIERRPFARYGFTPRRMPSDFFAGLAWGFGMLSLLVGMLRLTHGIAFDGLALHGAVAFTYAGKWAIVFLLVGLFEEFFTRGYLQFTVARGVAGIVRTISPANRHAHTISFWVAAFIFSVCLFMAGHLKNAGENPVGLIAVGLAGTVFAFSLYRTGSLWWAVGMHASWDWAQSFFYGTPDSGTRSLGHLLATHPIGSTFLSGGDDGPEGSILVVPTLLLVALVIHRTLPRRDYPVTPDQANPRA